MKSHELFISSSPPNFLFPSVKVFSLPHYAGTCLWLTMFADSDSRFFADKPIFAEEIYFRSTKIKVIGISEKWNSLKAENQKLSMSLMEQSNLGTDQKKNQNGLNGVIYRKKKKSILKNQRLYAHLQLKTAEIWEYVCRGNWLENQRSILCLLRVLIGPH